VPNTIPTTFTDNHAAVHCAPKLALHNAAPIVPSIEEQPSRLARGICQVSLLSISGLTFVDLAPPPRCSGRDHGPSGCINCWRYLRRSFTCSYAEGDNGKRRTNSVFAVLFIFDSVSSRLVCLRPQARLRFLHIGIYLGTGGPHNRKASVPRKRFSPDYSVIPALFPAALNQRLVRYDLIPDTCAELLRRHRHGNDAKGLRAFLARFADWHGCWRFSL